VRGADYHYGWTLPSSIGCAELIRLTNVISAACGIRSQQHLSESRLSAVSVMERRAHSHRCEALPKELPDDMGECAAHRVVARMAAVC
jgi:UV DNA damage endonuclease